MQSQSQSSSQSSSAMRLPLPYPDQRPGPGLSRWRQPEWAPVSPVSVSATLTAAPPPPLSVSASPETPSPGRAGRLSGCGWIPVVGGWAVGEGKLLILCRQDLRLGGPSFGPSVPWLRSPLPIGFQRGERERRSPPGPRRRDQAWVARLVAHQIAAQIVFALFCQNQQSSLCTRGPT